MKHIFFLVCGIFCCSFASLHAQKQIIEAYNADINGKEVSFTEFINALERGNTLITGTREDCEYVIKDVKVRFNTLQDKVPGGMDYRFGQGNKAPVIHIKSNMRISNIDWDTEFWFVPVNMVFEGHVWFTNTTRMKAIFTDCIFRKSFAFFSNDADFLEFKNCTFQNGFRLARGVMVDYVKFDGCVFDIKRDLRDAISRSFFGIETSPLIISNKIQNIDVTLQNCRVLVADSLRSKPQFYVQMGNSVFSNIRFINTEIQTSLDLQNSSIANNFLLSKSPIHDKIYLSGVNMNPLGTRMDWELISRKIAIQDKIGNRVYSYNELRQIPIDFFNDLFSNYSIIYTAFKSQGNRYSTNQCYIEWKNLETEYLRKRYAREQNIEIYFTYLMNLFLDTFCDYGTNPLKSLYMSFYVLLAFAALYFFLPHNFGYQRHNLFEVLGLYVNYWHQDERLLNELREERLRQEREEAKVINYLRSIHERRAPVYFYALAIPDYILHHYKAGASRTNYRLHKYILRHLGDKPFLGRVFAQGLFLAVVSGVVLQHLLFRVLDCIALSINIFSTLGFGNTEARGLPMYITVIEGFTGWFLLSFFSLSLISQLIN